VKFTLNRLGKPSEDADRRWPGYVFGGRVRTSTLMLIVALVAVAWVYNSYRPPEKPPAQVVPPGFVPDPNYTWVQRSRVDQPPSTVTVTPTSMTITPGPPATTTTTPPAPPVVLPTLPCIPPFCTPSPTPTTSPQLPQPGPGPVPQSAPPAS
jgi:hypothetical protein